MRCFRAEYAKRKNSIKKRLRDFRNNYRQGDGRIFEELCFCLLTPQSKAVNCDKAIKELKKRNLLFTGPERGISNVLRGLARFHNKKAAYIVSARKTFRSGKGFELKRYLDGNDIFETREWLVKNIKGMGYKEASHFLRNIGLGKDMAILDTHVLKNLERSAVIRKAPPTISVRNYTAIEEKMRKFAAKIKIPLEELDLLFWSRETGFVFK